MNERRVNQRGKAKIRWVLLCLLLTGLIAAGCRASRTGEAEPELSFTAQMQVDAEQQFHVSLGVENSGSRLFAGDEAFHGEMELRYADGSQAGELRARAELISLSRLEPGETARPLAWRCQLDPGAYTLTWGADKYGETLVGFQVVERDGRLYLES